jgi:8-oxo-dGTP pyrophosphatase MutT (NUDIX family)
MTVQAYEIPPPQFSPQIQVACCYVEVEGTILLLQRTQDKSEPHRWGVPAGKLEPKEDPHKAALRELFEETGISVKNPSQIRQLGSLYMRKPHIDYILHIFKVDVDLPVEVKISGEHQTFKWTSPQDREAMDLVTGAKEALAFYHKKSRN